MAENRLKEGTASLEAWRVAKRIHPSQRGAIKLARAYGAELLCVRYRENPDRSERLTTVELVVERAVIQKRDDPVVAFKLKQGESDLQYKAMAKGATYNHKTGMWQLARSEVLRLGLRKRIAITPDDLYAEQVHP